MSALRSTTPREPSIPLIPTSEWAVVANSFAINVNNPLPTVSIDSIANTPILPNTQTPTPVSGRLTPVVLKFHTNAPNNSKVTKVELFKDNVLVPFMPDTYSSGSYNDLPQDQPLTGGEFRIMVDFSNDTAGAHTLQAKATDAVGNEGLSETANVTVEAAAPTVSITSISGSPIPPFSQSPTPAVTVVGNSMTADVKYKSNSGRGVETLQLWLDHTEGTPFGEGGTGTLAASQAIAPLFSADMFGNVRNVSNPAALQGTQTFTIDTTAWTDGNHTLAAVAIEKKSDGTTYSQGVSNHQPLTINHAGTDAPPVSVYLSASNVTDASALLSWTASAASDFLKYEIHKSTIQGFTPDATTLVGSSLRADLTAFALSPLTSGTTYYLKVVVWDNANQTSASNEVAVTTLAAGNDLPSVTTISYTYSAVGDKTSMEDTRGVTLYEYDVVHRLAKVTEPDGKFVSYTYNAKGQRTQMVDHFSGTTTYAYDVVGREISVTDRNSGVTTFQYDASGNRTKMTYANGMVADYVYNNRNWLLSVHNRKSDNTVIADFDYSYDLIGNRTQVVEKQLDIDNTTLHEATVQFGYDALYRLTSERRTGWTPYHYEYSYDPLGNRLQLVQKDPAGNVVGTTAYSYNNLNQMLTAGNTSFTYDLAGNQTTKTTNGITTTMTWDFRNKMIGYVTGDTDIRYRYDGEGVRIKKEVVNGATTNFIFDTALALPALLFETDASSTATAAYQREQNGLLVSQTLGTTTSYYAFEAIGSTRALTGGDQSVTDTYAFDAWGDILHKDGITENPFLYIGMQGYYADEDTGLMSLGIRWYESEIGRFTSFDPLEAESLILLQAMNLYTYTSNNPTTFVDPSGLSPIGNWWNSRSCAFKCKSILRFVCFIGGRLAMAPCIAFFAETNLAAPFICASLIYGGVCLALLGKLCSDLICETCPKMLGQ